MEEEIDKQKLPFTSCAYRRINVQHEFDEHLRRQSLTSNLHCLRHQEELFNRKLTQFRNRLENIESHVGDGLEDDIDDEQPSMAPRCFLRIQNHFRLLNMSSETEKRVLCQAPSYKKSNKPIASQVSNLSEKKSSHEMKRIPLYQSRLPVDYSSRSKRKDHSLNSNAVEEKGTPSHVDRQRSDEEEKQMKNGQRKMLLLKGFDELKHSIDDPYAVLSALASLSRSIPESDTERE